MRTPDKRGERRTAAAPRRRLSFLLSILVGATVSLIACSDDDDPIDPGTDPVVAAFPADFQNSYTLVRDCRETADHGLGVTIQVWADPGSVQAYLDGTSFEEGAVLVKPLYFGEDCEPGNLLGYAVMVKGPSGTDPDTNDWLWQEVEPDLTVSRDGLLTDCSGCHSNCASRDYACTEE